MFREMRRKNQLLSLDECNAVLDRGTSGVMAVLGDDDYPYAVPLSYVRCGSKIFFHSAKEGHKLDAIAKFNKVSFCVIDMDDIVPDDYTSYFRSVIVFGRVRILDNDDEKRTAIEKLAERYFPSREEGRLKEIEKTFERLCMIELTIEHMTGKEAIELVREKSGKIL